jgi:lipoyl(octanoyl) transferase
MPVNKITFRDLGLIDYKKAWDYQEELFQQVIRSKGRQEKMESNQAGYLLFCEHPPVFTLGKSGSDRNLLIDTELLNQKGIVFYRINRGGDITYHGPGQLVGYPILDLEMFGLTIRKYIYLLEEAVIRTLGDMNVPAGRLNGATGVWLGSGSNTRKICAIGVRASRQVTMHGFAFNINNDLSPFQLINPCGFTDKGVTSLKKEKEEEISLEKVKRLLSAHLASLIGFETYLP